MVDESETAGGGKGKRFIRRMLTPGESLAERVMHAGIWSVALRGMTRSIGFIRNVVLARLLAPEDFGLFGIALLILSIIERFSESGLRTALVQKRDDIEEYLDTAWTVLASRGLALALALYVAAPYVGRFFEEPAAAPLIQVLGLSVFLRGLPSTGVLYFRRELEFHRQFILRSGDAIVELVVSIIAAIILKSAWALMIGMIAGNLTSLIASYALHPYRPKIRVRWEQVRELSRFGRWVFVHHILLFLSLKADKAIIAKLLGAPALGVYMLAWTISEVVAVEVGRLTNQVAFPAYSRMNGDKKRLRKAFSLANELVFSIALPVALVLVLLAEPLTKVVLGPRWMDVAIVLPLLALAGVIRAVGKSGGAIFNGIGRPEIAVQVMVVNMVVLYAAIIPLSIAYGIRGVGLSVLIGVAVAVPFSLFRIRAILELDTGALLRPFVPGILLSLASVTPVLALLQVAPSPSFVQMVATGALWGVVYLAVAWFLWKTGSHGPLGVLSLIRNRGARSRAALAPAVR